MKEQRKFENNSDGQFNVVIENGAEEENTKEKWDKQKTESLVSPQTVRELTVLVIVLASALTFAAMVLRSIGLLIGDTP